MSVASVSTFQAERQPSKRIPIFARMTSEGACAEGAVMVAEPRQTHVTAAFILPPKLRRATGTPLALIRHPDSGVPFVPSPADANAKKKSRTWLWISLAIVVLGAGGGWWWQSQQAAHATTKAAKPQRAPAQYYALEPAFVVNLVDADADAVRYLQADVQLVTRDNETRAAVETHAPAIRNHLLLLFGQQSVAQLSQRSGKERLQAAALAEVRQVLKHEAAPDKVEAVIFTSLVTQ